jgi:hypothetical protein
MFKKKASHPIWRNFLIYVAPTLVLTAGLIVAALSGVSKSKIMNGCGLVLFTSCIFGTFLMEGRPVWHKKRFWALAFVGLLVHTCVCIWLFRGGLLIPGKIWVLVAIAELFGLIIVRRQFLFSSLSASDSRLPKL